MYGLKATFLAAFLAIVLVDSAYGANYIVGARRRGDQLAVNQVIFINVRPGQIVDITRIFIAPRPTRFNRIECIDQGSRGLVRIAGGGLNNSRVALRFTGQRGRALNYRCRLWSIRR